jgi:CHAT domain-containing protein
MNACRHSHDDLITRLRLSAPRYAAQVGVDPLRLPQIQRLLPSGTTLLSYLVTPEKTLAFLVTPTTIKALVLPVGQFQLEAAVPKLGGDEADTAVRAFYRMVVAPLATELRTPRVLLLPSGILNQVSFAALAGDGKLFGDEHAICYLPSASALQFLPWRPAPKHPELLAVSNRDAGKGFNPLARVDGEARAIAALYGGMAIANVTESEFVAKAPGADYLHIAAHGELDVRNPTFSRLLLSPDPTNDGSLRTAEIQGLDLRRADLVTLSACETARGVSSASDDFQSLSRAFLYAGAQSVIATLWPVDDETASILMPAFYRHLQAGKSKASALQTAQQETRKKMTEQLAAGDPNHRNWAAFILTGLPGDER